ncbi:MAG TPA: nucleoside-diphosphate sugar epimerase [Planctomycetaceae bacterium]|nr:nucleoside-diphosphate sugar epimerase [Planctomycetaceae bacterium]
MAHCLVTGGAGFIGSHLVEALLERGDRVRVIDDFSTGSTDNLAGMVGHPNLKIRDGSITDPALLEAAVVGVDAVYHLAAAVGVKLVAENPVRTIHTNIYPTELLLRLASEEQLPFFLASTSEVYGKNPKATWCEEDDLQLGPTSRPRWAYGCSKAIDEFLGLAYHRQRGLPVVVGRFFNVVGPRQVGAYGMVIPRFVEQALGGGPVIVYDDGSQVRCFAHVREVVSSILGLMDHPEAAGGVFNIGGDQPVSVRQLAEKVVAKIGGEIAIEHIAYGEAYGDDFEDIQRRAPEVDKLERAIGSKPNMTLDQILDDIIAWKRAGTGEEDQDRS